MTPRERVMKAVACQPVDQMPTRFNGGGEEARLIAAQLGIPVEGEWFEALMRRFRVDMRNVDTNLIAGEYPSENNCLVDAKTAHDVDRLWPPSRLMKNRTLERAGRQVIEWDKSGACPAVLLRTAGLMAMVMRMRGQEQACYDLAEENAVFLRIMDVMEEWIADAVTLGYKTFGNRLDIVYYADELGMQTGLMYSPKAIEKHFLPRFERLSKHIHGFGGKVFLHSCGAIEPMIESIIGAGVDILNPIQPRVPGMEPEHLATRFGGRVCFCGGIDMQHLLPLGAPQEVSAEVQRYAATLGPGYILDFANILHPDIPAANVVAMYDAPRKGWPAT
jgi:hypothetical protein